MKENFRPVAALCLVLAVMVVSAVYAAWMDDGIPVCTASYSQSLPQITEDGDGGAIVVWPDARAHPSYTDIYANRADEAGTILWSANGRAVCVQVMSTQYAPQLIPSGDGGAFIVWQDYRNGNYDIYAQRVNASGYGQWTANGVAVCTAADVQGTPQLTSDGAGGVIITWSDRRDYSTSSYDIYAQRLNSNGVAQWTANGVVVSDYTTNQQMPRIVSDGAGGAIICWRDYRDGDFKAYAQRVDQDGSTLWTADGVRVCTEAGRQDLPRMVPDGSGGAIIGWVDWRMGVIGYDIYAQRLNSSGALQWTATGVAVCTAAGVQTVLCMDSDGSGGAVFAWDDDRRGSSVDSDVYVQRIGFAGNRYWTVDGVAACTLVAHSNSTPDITSDGAGGAIVTWVDGRNSPTDVANIYAQRIDAGGAAMWTTDGVDICLATGSQTSPAIAPDGQEGAFIAWTDNRSGETDIYMQRVFSDGYAGDARPEVVSTSPDMNELDVEPSTDISATFNVVMNPSTINGSTFIASGAMTGLHSGAISYSSMTAILNPSGDFAAGELVSVSLSGDVESAGGALLGTSHVWQFTAAAAGGTAVFVEDDVYAVGTLPRAVGTADLDGDGDIDLVSANRNTHTLSVLMNAGDGTYAPQVTYAVGQYPVCVCTADLDGNGSIDLASASSSENDVSVRLNNGNGTFGARTDYAVDISPGPLCAADLDGDGDQDLVTGNTATVSVLLNNGNGTFAARSNYTSGNYLNAVAASDFDGDGDIDIAVTNYNDDTVTLLRNNGAGVLAISHTLPVGNGPSGLCTGDLDGDGDPDIAVADRLDGTISMILNNGDDSFAPRAVYGSGTGPVAIRAADLDGDGDLDLANVNYNSDDVTVLLNSGSGVFIDGGEYAPGGGPYDLFAADLDGDGALDLAVANLSDANLSVLLNLDFVFVSLPITATGVDIPFVSGPDTLAIMNFASETLDSLRIRAFIDAVPPNIPGGTDWVRRYYEITPYPPGATFEADIELFYAQQEFDDSGIPDEATLHLYRYDEGEAEWQVQYDMVDVVRNSVSCSGVTEFSVWAFTGSSSITGDGPDLVPDATVLHQNYPNPFNPMTQIRYVLSRDSEVKLAVYDLLGREIVTLVDGRQPAGQRTVTWNGRDTAGNRVASGVYFYRLLAGEFAQTRKMVLMR